MGPNVRPGATRVLVYVARLGTDGAVPIGMMHIQVVSTSAVLVALAACSSGLPLGQSCTTDAECASGFCQGVCDHALGDTDGDGLRNLTERQLGTSPWARDSDGDGLSDAEEVGDVSAPTNSNGNLADGIDALESNLADTDNDCVSDHLDATNAAPPAGLFEATCKVDGVCAFGTQLRCVSGEVRCDYSRIAAYSGSSESLCDGRDDDCDGQTDEDFGLGTACVPQERGECRTGVWACSASGGLECSVVDVLSDVPCVAGCSTGTCHDGDCVITSPFLGRAPVGTPYASVVRRTASGRWLVAGGGAALHLDDTLNRVAKASVAGWAGSVVTLSSGGVVVANGDVLDSVVAKFDDTLTEQWRTSIASVPTAGAVELSGGGLLVPGVQLAPQMPTLTRLTPEGSVEWHHSYPDRTGVVERGVVLANGRPALLGRRDAARLLWVVDPSDGSIDQELALGADDRETATRAQLTPGGDVLIAAGTRGIALHSDLSPWWTFELPDLRAATGWESSPGQLLLTAVASTGSEVYVLRPDDGELMATLELGTDHISGVARDPASGRLLFAGIGVDERGMALQTDAFGNVTCDAMCPDSALSACDDGQACTFDTCTAQTCASIPVDCP